MHGNNVLCCQRGCSSALFSHANQRVLQGPSSLHRLNARKQGQGKKVSHETGGAEVLLLLVPRVGSESSAVHQNEIEPD